ncbi:MAG: cysteine--tRNA ligase, partial [Kiritimatiellae bacterium]|nr:cysteine--tRNA ligase [Kiritimatiellia bacterium]
PHHENEIAQAEAATGKPFVKTWMHCAHLKVNGEKMSKSAGNFFTLRDLTEKGYTGREIRYVLINAHYRTGLNFAFSALDDARKSLARIDECVGRVEAAAKGASAAGEPPEFAAKCLADFTAAVNDDLNLPSAFAALFDLVRQTNAHLAEVSDPAALLSVFRRMDEVLGVVFFGRAAAAEVPPEVQALVDARAAARAAKNWAESDRLRAEIAAAGWVVKDSRDGQSLSPVAQNR